MKKRDRPKRRYCEMCDAWFPMSKAECQNCGAPTIPEDAMSLYNMIHGVNAMAPLLMGMLGLKSSADVPRFRDCYWNGKHIVLYTRTGGGNRDCYEHPERHRHNCGSDCKCKGPYNSDLRSLAGFEYDEDDDFDCTYASFYFTPQPPFAEALKLLAAEDATPEQKWERFLGELQSGAKTPQTERVLAAIAPTLKQLTESLAASQEGARTP